ncbi:ornithine cyclodeaminase, partial [Pseudoalteromonas sp. S1649]
VDNISCELGDLDKKKNYESKCDSDKTLYKSVGTAFSDLITAHYFYKSLKIE